MGRRPSEPPRRVSREGWAVACSVSAIAAAIVVPVAGHVNVWTGALAGGLCFVPVRWAAARMPDPPSGARRRHPVISAAWCLLVLLAVVQMARLSAFMVDSSRLWGSTVPDPVAANHQCLAAYVHAADLCRRGETNVYDEQWYPAFTAGFDAAQGVRSPVEGLGRWVVDPYEYPPPFLLLPRAALAITNSFEHIRTAWFVIQSLCLLSGGVLLAQWIGGRPGLLVGVLLPAVFASFPTMLNFQFGQFHAMAIMLALAAMVAFERGRLPVGGALLSFAILSKVFPGLLLVTLAARRKWREIGWTIGAGVLFVLLSLLVLGADPFVAFVSYQFPRIVSGEAFSFVERADVPFIIVSRNFSIHGLVAKLRLLGVTGAGSATAQALTWAYTAVLLWLAWRARLRVTDRRLRVMVWIALLNLAALRSPVAPSAYVTAPVLWLLPLLAAEIKGRYSLAIALTVAWIVIMGLPPLPARTDLIVNLFSQALVFALGLWVLLRAGPQTSEEPRSSSLSHDALDVFQQRIDGGHASRRIRQGPLARAEA
jgi:Glycosyltransferase family 87